MTSGGHARSGCKFKSGDLLLVPSPTPFASTRGAVKHPALAHALF